MKTLKSMSLAGMYLNTMIETLKHDEEVVSDFDARAYLVEQLEQTFLDIQTDIILLVNGSVQDRIEEICDEREG